MTDMMRTDLNAIPEQPNDKNYVDVWFEKQRETFRKEHKSIWALIAGATIGKSGQLNFLCSVRIRLINFDKRSISNIFTRSGSSVYLSVHLSVCHHFSDSKLI